VRVKVSWSSIKCVLRFYFTDSSSSREVAIVKAGGPMNSVQYASNSGYLPKLIGLALPLRTLTPTLAGNLQLLTEPNVGGSGLKNSSSNIVIRNIFSTKACNVVNKADRV
jgi:hypothetical protein